MKVFLTGATGFIGTHIIPELLGAGHQVLGLTRSPEGADKLRSLGVEPHLGSLEDPETLKSGARRAEGVIHCAFDHDFNNFVANCEKDRRNIEAMAAALAGTGRPLVITSGTGIGSPGAGQPARESVFNPEHPNPRIASEIAGQAASAQGVNVIVVRLPQVHDPEKQGLITPLVEHARQAGTCAYLGEGQNRWPAAHVTDVARLYRLALEKGEPSRYHAVAEEGIRMRQIMEVLGAGLGLPVVSLPPEQAEQHFGMWAMFAGLDMPADSAWTRQTLGWTPIGPDLISDLKKMNYAAV